MFINKKLNQCFNCNNKDMFVSRVFDLCKAVKFDEIQITSSPVSDDCLEFAIESMNKHIQKRLGKVYIAVNKSHDGLVKIGRTTKEIYEREKSLNSAGVIGKMEIVWYDHSIDSVLTETFIHQRMKQYHVDREFFNIDVVGASNIIRECTDMTYDFYNKIKRIYDEFY